MASLSQGRTATGSAACLHTNQSRSYLNHLASSLVLNYSFTLSLPEVAVRNLLDLTNISLRFVQMS